MPRGGFAERASASQPTLPPVVTDINPTPLTICERDAAGYGRFVGVDSGSAGGLTFRQNGTSALLLSISGALAQLSSIGGTTTGLQLNHQGGGVAIASGGATYLTTSVASTLAKLTADGTNAAGFDFFIAAAGILRLTTSGLDAINVTAPGAPSTGRARLYAESDSFKVRTVKNRWVVVPEPASTAYTGQHISVAYQDATTNATPKALAPFSMPAVGGSSSACVKVRVTATQLTAGGDRSVWDALIGVQGDGTTASAIGAGIVNAARLNTAGAAAWALTLVFAGLQTTLNGTGAAGVNITWTVELEGLMDN